MINKQFKCKGKIPNGSISNLKQIDLFCKFKDKSDLEGQGHQFSKSYETFRGLMLIFRIKKCRIYKELRHLDDQ